MNLIVGQGMDSTGHCLQLEMLIEKSELPKNIKKNKRQYTIAQKDILYKIYEEINFEKAKEVHENDY